MATYYPSNSSATATTFDCWPLWTADNNGVTCVTTGAWDTWNVIYSDSGTTTNAAYQLWSQWQAQPVVRPYVPSAPLLPTPEQIAARAEETRMRVARQSAVRSRAKALLLSVLSKEQAVDLQENGAFFVFSKSGRLYRIYNGSSGNVDEIDMTGRRIARYCAHPSPYVPDEDAMLSQMLMLLNQEDEFLRMANSHSVRDRSDNANMAQMVGAFIARYPALAPLASPRQLH